MREERDGSIQRDSGANDSKVSDNEANDSEVSDNEANDFDHHADDEDQNEEDGLEANDVKEADDEERIPEEVHDELDGRKKVDDKVDDADLEKSENYNDAQAHTGKADCVTMSEYLVRVILPSLNQMYN